MTRMYHGAPVRFVLVRSLLLVAVPAAAPGTLGAQAFEGSVTMRELYLESAPLSATLVAEPDSLSHLSLADLQMLADSAGVPVERTELTYFVSGSRLRSVPPGDSSGTAEFVIADFAEGLYRVVDPAQMLIVEWRGRTAGDTTTIGGYALPDDPDISAIGQSREVNGFLCDGWVMRRGAAFVEASWLTAELDDLTRTFARLALLSEELSGSGESGRSILRLLDRGFPVRTVTADADAGLISAAEITAVERRALAADACDPPPGYLTVTVER
jgi:hypothetical protein